MEAVQYIIEWARWDSLYFIRRVLLPWRQGDANSDLVFETLHFDVTKWEFSA